MTSLDIGKVSRLRPSNQIHYFPSVASTMTEASRLVGAGAPHGATVVAEEQTAGVGRLGRSWISQAGVGIYCSVILRLALPPVSLPVASIVVGLAVADAIQKKTDLICDLRWPNDVLIGSKKVAGILPHLSDGCIIAGIGVNVNNTAFPPDLRTPATSLLLESGGHTQDRETLLAALLSSLEKYCVLLLNEGHEAILRTFTAASSYAVDRRVIVEESGLSGITAGLDENGFLLVRSDSGSVMRISSGGVRPHPGSLR